MPHKETDLNLDPYSTEEPAIAALIKEYERCSPYSHGYNRLVENEKVRFNLWDGKNADGKKHDSADAPAFPFDGASDCEVFLADSTINENVAVCVVAFWRSVVRAIGVENGDKEQAANITKVLEWLMQTRLYKELVREVELSAQYIQTYGICALKIVWQRELGKRPEKITMEALEAMAEMAEPNTPLAVLPSLISDPALEEQATAVLLDAVNQIVEIGFAKALGGDAAALMENYAVTRKRALRLVRDLRDKGVGEIPLPYFCKNQPCIAALKPWEEIYVPPFMTDIQRAQAVFEKEWVSEVELRSRATLEGWDEDWVESAVQQRGKQSTWNLPFGHLGSDLGSEFTWIDADTTGHDLIELLHAYQWQLDEDNIPCRYHTVFHADVKDFYAKHERLEYEHKQMPFVLGLRERWNRSLTSSRGIPQIMRSRQREVKVQRDSITDLTSLAVVPPLNLYDNAMGGKYIFGPGATNTVTPGREPKFMEVPKSGAPVAFELMNVISMEVDNDFGRLSEKVSPVRAQVKQQMMLNSFLLMWTEAFQQMFQLVRQYMPPEQFMRITGAQEAPGKEDVNESHDFILSFDPRELDMEHVTAEFKAIAEAVAPMNQAGTIDFGRLVKAMVRAINPSLAKEIIVDVEEGAGRVKKQVKDDLLAMLNGMEPEFGVDADPTAGMKTQFLQEMIQSSPDLQQRLQQSQGAQEMLEKYMKNLQFNAEQTQNKQRGRIGV